MNAPTGILFNIMRFAINDGPGIRTTIFFKGCPLHCTWCHNPESISPEPELMYHRERCTVCGACVAVCPQKAITLVDGRIETDRSRCRACGRCIEVCNADARSIAGRLMTVDEVMREVERDIIFYSRSGGGVTLSGGEPMDQHEFAEAILRACKERAIHTVVDTAGAVHPAFLDTIIGLVDLFLYDIKFLDKEKLLYHTGAARALLCGNLRRLIEKGARVIVRVPVIPGINDGEKEWKELATFINRTDGIEAIQLLPYHASGRQKYARLGRKDPLGPVAPPDEGHLKSLASHLHKNVIIGG